MLIKGKTAEQPDFPSAFSSLGSLQPGAGRTRGGAGGLGVGRNESSTLVSSRSPGSSQDNIPLGVLDFSFTPPSPVLR